MTDPIPAHQPISRMRLIELAEIALAMGEARFVRRVTLAWLATYPGDLAVSLLQARSLLQDGHPRAALPILEGLCLADPEYRQAQEILAGVCRSTAIEKASLAAGCAFALGGRPPAGIALPPWAPELRQAHQALALGDLAKAEHFLHRLLMLEPPLPLVRIWHLRALLAQQPAPSTLAIRNLAKSYHDQWPGCIAFMLTLAATLMDSGDEEQAVALLHQAAAQDVGGQVAERLWGSEHPYRSLWPTSLEIGRFGPTPLDEIPLPAAVAAALGQNLLPEPHTPSTAPSTISGHPSAITESHNLSAAVPGVPPSPENLRSIQTELEKVAARLDHPDLARSDGRFPVYVIFTTRRGLEAQYGPDSLGEIERTLRRLANALRADHTWEALVLIADDPSSTTAVGLKPVAHTDAWGLKLLLADLDAILGKRGEMIGALLIVGGPGVVPFHHLPNPVDDVDTDVPSDNPYGSRDENYFIPEWPVGRIPGDASNDVKALLQPLEAIIARHQAQARRQPRLWRWWQQLRTLAERYFRIGNGKKAQVNLGYTAAIWRRASLAVYRAIGEPRSLLVSPPYQAETVPLTAPAFLGYFNLHGIPDAVEWFGQRDPTDAHGEGNGHAPDYPVALRPQDIPNDGNTPRLVFSEACYGAHIFEKTVEQSLALKFLASGSQAVVGSTCISYGSIAMPLIAADLLGRAFWNALGEGLPAGEALRRAKIVLARQMHQRQGYLDGEDQKTLISFILLGDPLAQPMGRMRTRKDVLRPLKANYTIKTVCDRLSGAEPQPIPPEMLAHVKHVVAQYLPGMSDASLQMADEHAECSATHGCPTAQMGAKSRPARPPHRKVITLSKQVQSDEKGPLPHQHHQYARLTLDEGGKVVKLAVSR